MKKTLYLFLIISMMLAAGACKKTGVDANALSDVSILGTGTYLVLDSTVNLNLNYSAIATSTVGIQVEQYKNGKPVDHIVVYVATSATYDTTKWHIIKTIPYTGKGTAISVTGAELAAALGTSPSNLSPGSVFTFYNRAVTKSGDYWDASNTGYANDGTNLISGSNYHSAFAFTAYVVCPFVAPVAGTYKVIEDDWVDWNPGDLVQVTDGPGANQVNLSQVYPGAGAGGISAGPNAFLVNVDPATGSATIPQQTVGNYGSPTNYWVQGANGNNVAGYIFSCTGYIGLNITWGAGSSSYGSFKLVLQKQ